jgi:hypothetical protein
MEVIQEKTDYRKFGNHVAFDPTTNYRCAVVFNITTCPKYGKKCVGDFTTINDYEYSDALEQGLIDIDYDSIPFQTICTKEEECSSCKLRTTK